MINNNQALILYLIANRLSCSITEIIKLCYLIDLGSYNKFGNKITDFNYIRYTYGPFDQRVYEEVNGLMSQGKLKYVCYPMPSGDEVCKYEFQDGYVNEVSFEGNQKSFIDEILLNLSSFNAHELTKLAYQTKPMRTLGAKLGGNENMGVELNLEINE